MLCGGGSGVRCCAMKFFCPNHEIGSGRQDGGGCGDVDTETGIRTVTSLRQQAEVQHSCLQEGEAWGFALKLPLSGISSVLFRFYLTGNGTRRLILPRGS